MELYDRIRRRREDIGMTQGDLAKILGYKSRSSINKIEMGENDIPQSKIKAFADALRTTTADLMGWENNERGFSIYSVPGIEPLPKMKKVPLLGTIACGEPITAVENIDCYISMPENVKGTFALKCKGDSMINARIFDGDVVYIKEQQDVENGEIAAVLIGDEATLKRVYKYPSKLVLRPENPMYEDFTYNKEEINEVRILGKAVAFLSAVR